MRGAASSTRVAPADRGRSRGRVSALSSQFAGRLAPLSQRISAQILGSAALGANSTWALPPFAPIRFVDAVPVSSDLSIARLAIVAVGIRDRFQKYDVCLDKVESVAHIVSPLVQPAWAWRFQND